MTSVARLQYAGGQEWQWQQLGACRGVEESRFFHPDNERGTERERREAGAMELAPAMGSRVGAELGAHPAERVAERAYHAVLAAFAKLGCAEVVPERAVSDRLVVAGKRRRVGRREMKHPQQQVGGRAFRHSRTQNRALGLVAPAGELV